MNQPRIALVSLFAGLLAASAFTTSANAQATASRIGVVNIRDVFVKMKETAEAQRQIEGLQQKLDSDQKKDAADLNSMKLDIETNTKPGTPERETRMDQLDAKNMEFQGEEQKLKVKMVRSQARQLKRAYDEIKAAVNEVAKKRGYDVVLVNNGFELPDNTADGQPEQIGNAIFSRTILYVADNVDMSAEVLATLDAKYAHPMAPAAPVAPGH